MALSAQRIEGFSKDFATPIRDFATSRDMSIFNTPTLDLDQMIEKGKALSDQVVNNVMDKISESKEFLDDLTRNAKNQFEKIVDLAQLGEEKIKSIIDDVFSGFPQKVIDIVKNMGSVCRNNALGNGLGAGGNLLGNPNCSPLGLGNANCPPGATKGLLGSIGSDISRLLKRGLDALSKGIKAIASLLGMGYNANLCNVLSSTLGMLGIEDKSAITIAVASVLNKEGMRGNVGAVLDIAKNNVGNLTALAPKALKLTASNLKLGSVFTGATLAHASASVRESFKAIDPNWNRSTSGKITTAGLTPNKDFLGLTNYDLKTQTAESKTSDDLDVAVLTDDSKFNAANSYNSKQQDWSLLA